MTNAVYLPELDPRNQPRSYAKLTRDGVGAVMEKSVAFAIMKGEPDLYEYSEVRMTPAVFEKLREFSGW